VTPVVVVVLWFSSEDLPPSELARALANVTAPLQAVPLRTHVPIGDYFATGLDAQGQILGQRAAAPLQADLLVTPTGLDDSGATFCNDTAAGCMLVPTPATAGQIGLTWAVSASVTLQWQFTSSDGHVYHSAPNQAGNPIRLVLTYDAHVGWIVDQQGTEQLNGFGLPAAVMLAPYGTVPTLLSNVAFQHGYGISSLYDHGIEGSDLQLQTTDGRTLGSFVWRFGVLLAADAPAHALLPDLPLAPPSELSAASASTPVQP
jgi:hypothetical protein